MCSSGHDNNIITIPMSEETATSKDIGFLFMEDLKEYFVGKGEVKGFIFNQIKKSEYAYIYEVKTSTKTYYEVFKKNINFDRVSYPSSKAFGKYAWTCGTLERANEYFNDINLKSIYLEENSI